MNFLRKFSTTILFLIFTISIKGQGCSDAGFCTINSLQPDQPVDSDQSENQLTFGISNGRADHGISVFGTNFEYHRQINAKSGLDVRLTTLLQNGNGIFSFGLSDIYLTGNRHLGKNVNLTLGAKIPLSNAGKQKDGVVLPMDYQSSLGTFDLIFGIGYEVSKVQLTVALQQPLTQNNNKFLAENYSPDSKLRKIQSTNLFKRRGDILLRVSYPIGIGRKFTVIPSILPIYHLGNDRFKDVDNMEWEIVGSGGLTLNGNIFFGYRIAPKSTIKLQFAAPFIVRESRPDGLTRSYVLNLEYGVQF